MYDLQTMNFDASNIVYSLQTTAISLVNMQRENSGHSIDYVQFNLAQQMSLFPEARNLVQQQFLGKAAMSLTQFEQALERIGKESRIKGVILYLRGLAMPLSDLQTMRDVLLRFKESGKEIICYAQDYGNADYYVASVADKIIMQPGGTLGTTGIILQQTYLKDGLEAVGLEADSVAISPYKGAGDTFTRNEPSEEGSAQINWILDSRYGQLVAGIAAGRDMSEEAVREMIDNAPYTDKQAHEKGFIDVLVNEEGLKDLLGAGDVTLWAKADNQIGLLLPKSPERYVAVLPLTGQIVPGESAEPPVDIPIPLVGGDRMGDITVVRAIRNLMKDDKAAAVVVYVDSPGGSATASEAITSALNELSKTRPVVVSMGSVAASGGYYISTPADWIVAQPGTVTGSIGVISMKLVSNETLRKMRFNPVTYLRGANAGIFSSNARFSDAERQKVRESIERIYEQFIQRVADARKMKVESVDEIGGGRVWTGEQALENGLVDQLGGLREAIAKARELAKLPEETPAALVRGKGKPLPAQVAEQLDPAAAMRYWHDNLGYIASGSAQMLLPFEWNE